LNQEGFPDTRNLSARTAPDPKPHWVHRATSAAGHRPGQRRRLQGSLQRPAEDARARQPPAATGAV